MSEINKEVQTMSSIAEAILGYTFGPLTKTKTFRAPEQSMIDVKDKFEELLFMMNIQDIPEITEYKIAQWSIELMSIIDLNDLLKLLAASYSRKLSTIFKNSGRLDNWTPSSSDMTTKEVLKELGLHSRQSVKNLIDNNILIARKHKGRYYITKMSVEAEKKRRVKSTKPKVKQIS